uniref:Uncharacterized protein n=1 Tax=Arion vulgaris TaxID=1028688 RepID=A0A0B7A7F7_9EUPU
MLDGLKSWFDKRSTSDLINCTKERQLWRDIIAYTSSHALEKRHDGLESILEEGIPAEKIRGRPRRKWNHDVNDDLSTKDAVSIWPM